MTNTVQAHYRAVTQSGDSIEARNGELPMTVHKLIVLAMTDVEAAEAHLAQHAELLAALNMLKAWDFGAAVKTHEDEKQMDKVALFARSAITKAEGGAA